VLIAQGRHHTDGRPLHDALGLLERLLQAAQASRRMGSAIEILVLQALALHAQDQTARAMIPLERALALAEPERYVRLFADEGELMAELLHHAASRGLMPDYARRLLAGFGDVSASPPPEARALAEPLSEREIEVLRLLAARLSSQEMADELCISVNTVRTHIRNIYDKLSVHNRAQAAERARALGLLSSRDRPLTPHPPHTLWTDGILPPIATAVPPQAAGR
jgi:LuxR family maltose regulon positive regulatory protein